MSAEKKEDDLSSFEAALAALMPRTDRLDRERLMFLAGQQSITAGQHPTLPSPIGRGTQRVPGGEVTLGRQARAWQAAFAVMSAIAATLLVMLVSRSALGPVVETANHAAPGTSLARDVSENIDADMHAARSRSDRSVFGLALLPAANYRGPGEGDSTYSYTQLLSRIIDKGVDSWEPRAAAPHNKKSIVTRPLTSRELMDQILEQIGSGPS